MNEVEVLLSKLKDKGFSEDKLLRLRESIEKYDGYVNVPNLFDAIVEAPELLDDEEIDIDRIIRHHDTSISDGIRRILKERENGNWTAHTKDKELIGELDGGKRKLYKLFTKRHFEDESIALNHCLGISDFFINLSDKGEIEVFSYCVDDKEYATILYDVKSNAIDQIKKHSNALFTNDDEELFPMLRMLALLRKTKSDAGRGRDFVSVADLELVTLEDGEILTDSGVKKLRDYDDDMLVFAGRYLCEANNCEDLQFASNVPNVVIDMTNASDSQKEMLTTLRGSLKDESDAVVYGNLQASNGPLMFPNAKSVTLRAFTHCGGNLYAQNADTFDAPKLEYVHRNLVLPKLRICNLKSLKTVGVGICLCSADSVNLPKFEYAGWTINIHSARSVDMRRLLRVEGDLILGALSDWELSENLSVRDTLYAPKNVCDMLKNYLTYQNAYADISEAPVQTWSDFK